MMYGGLGIGGAIIVGLITLLMGGDPGTAIQNATEMMGGGQTIQSEYTPSAEEQELALFASRILAGTEDVWTDIFQRMGKKYIPPKLVLFTDSVQSACGGATAQSGPFYCSGDQCVYIDLSFFSNMKREIGADGDFAYAYVIAHEVGHHVQYLLGTLQQAHNQMARVSEKQSNQISVRLELQADFYAGVWAHHDNKLYGSLEAGDIDEAIDCAQKIGDNYGVITSYDGYDEISLTSGFKLVTNDFEKVFTPKDMGFNYVDPKDIYGGETAADAMKIFDSVLEGTSTEAQKNVILANAACGIAVLDRNKSIEESIAIARESLDSGKALAAFKKYLEINA